MRKGLADLRRRMMRVLREFGPRPRRILDNMAGGREEVLDSLVRDRLVRVISSKRGTKYGAARS